MLSRLRLGFHLSYLSRLSNFSSGFSLFGVVLGIVCSIISFWKFSWDDFETLPIGLLCIFLVIWVFGREFYLSRKQKYANITHHYASISLEIGELCVDISNDIAGLRSRPDYVCKISDEEFCKRIVRILDDFSVMFDLLTATKCRGSIKTLVHRPNDGKEETYVFCFARDKISGVSNRKSDVDRAKQLYDPISRNTDFKALIFGEGPFQDHYLNNDIWKNISNGTYNSTSIEWNKKARIDIGEYSQPNYHVLPYRSTMVWPIRTFDTTSADGGESSFMGFLCVDSEHRNVFNSRFDKSLGLAVAAQLVGVFHLKQQLIAPYVPSIAGEAHAISEAALQSA